MGQSKRTVAWNLYSGNLYGGSAQGVSGTSSGSAAVTGESSSGGRSLPVDVLGNGSGGASLGGQVSACAGGERPSLFSDSGNRLPVSNPFVTAFASLGPAERYEAQFMGASEFLNRRLNEEFQRAFEAGIPSSALYPSPETYHIGTPSDQTTSEGFRSIVSQRTPSVHSHPTSSPVSFGLSTPVQSASAARALEEGCLMLEVLWHRQDFLWGILPGWQDLMGYLWMTQFLEFLLEVFLVRIQVRDLYQPKLRFHLHLHNKELEIQSHSYLWVRVQWAIFWFKWHRKWIVGM